MNEKTENRLLVILVIILIIAVIALVFSTIRIRKTGAAVTTTSQVVIQAYVALAMSTELGLGINFGSLNPNTVDAPAQQNFDNTQTLYSIDVSSNSNTAADICIRADGPMTTGGGDTISLTNYDWSNSVGINNDLNPAGPPATDMGIIYQAAGSNVPVGGFDYFRFWLSVPGGQAAGTYTNIVYFQGVPTGTPCT